MTNNSKPLAIIIVLYKYHNNIISISNITHYGYSDVMVKLIS